MRIVVSMVVVVGSLLLVGCQGEPCSEEELDDIWSDSQLAPDPDRLAVGGVMRCDNSHWAVRELAEAQENTDSNNHADLAIGGAREQAGFPGIPYWLNGLTRGFGQRGAVFGTWNDGCGNGEEVLEQMQGASAVERTEALVDGCDLVDRFGVSEDEIADNIPVGRVIPLLQIIGQHGGDVHEESLYFRAMEMALTGQIPDTPFTERDGYPEADDAAQLPEGIGGVELGEDIADVPGVELDDAMSKTWPAQLLSVRGQVTVVTDNAGAIESIVFEPTLYSLNDFDERLQDHFGDDVDQIAGGAEAIESPYDLAEAAEELEQQAPMKVATRYRDEDLMLTVAAREGDRYLDDDGQWDLLMDDHSVLVEGSVILEAAH